MKNGKFTATSLWFAFLLTLLWLTSMPLQGCSSARPVPVKETVTEKITETVHDTVFKTEKDSSAYQALLDCQNGKVVIKEVTKANAGKYLNAPKVSIKDNALECDCEARAQELHAQWISQHKEINKTKEVPIIIEKPFKWWQTALMWVGGIFLITLLITFLILIYNPFKFLTKNGK